MGVNHTIGNRVCPILTDRFIFSDTGKKYQLIQGKRPKRIFKATLIRSFSIAIFWGQKREANCANTMHSM